MHLGFLSPFAMSTGTPASAGALYAARCVDKSSSTPLRVATRAAHLDWIASQEALFPFAGPLRPDATAPPIGSLLIMHGSEADTSASVARRLEEDPYAKAGLFEGVEVRKWVCGMASEAPLPEPLFAVWCVDKAGMRAVRKETRPRHLDWWRGAGRRGMIGPFPAEDGEGAVGSLIVCEGESVEEVGEWAKSDPYNEVGLFERAQVHKVVKVVEDGKLLLETW